MTKRKNISGKNLLSDCTNITNNELFRQFSNEFKDDNDFGWRRCDRLVSPNKASQLNKPILDLAVKVNIQIVLSLLELVKQTKLNAYSVQNKTKKTD